MADTEPYHWELRLLKVGLAGVAGLASAFGVGDPITAAFTLKAVDEGLDFLSDYVDRHTQAEQHALLAARLDLQDARIEVLEAAVLALSKAKLPVDMVGQARLEYLVGAASAHLDVAQPEDRVEAERVIRSVYAELLKTPVLLWRQVDALRRADAAASLVSNRRREWKADRNSPSALLNPHFAIVPFRARTAEWTELAAWCDDAASVRVRLYTGVGGMGKTRLLIGFTKHLLDSAGEHRWHAGFLSGHARSAEPAIIDQLMLTPERVLVVIDYAEGRTDEVVAILERAVETAGSRRVRLVLLARGGGAWWQAMRRRGNGVGDLLSATATTEKALPPFSLAVSDRRETFDDAVQAFAQRLGKSTENIAVPDLALPDYGNILFIHAAALTALEGGSVESVNAVLDFILDREQGFWDRRKPIAVSSAAFAHVAAVVTARRGADTREAARKLIRGVPLMGGQTEDTVNQVAEILHDMYRGPKWLNPIEPDVLGERLVTLAFSDRL